MQGKFSFFAANEIKPLGWMKKQLDIQLNGLSGNLYKIWPDIRDSKWIGGDREGWERVPYWLDGAIPLAYLTENDELKSAVKRYIDAIISRQDEDGWICPCTKEQRKNYDTWAIHLVTKVLVRYYDFSKDERVPEVLHKCLKNYYDLLSNGEIKLFDWAKYRWFEIFPAINFLYSRKKEKWLISLAKIIKEQGMNYSEVEKKWEKPLNKWDFDTHIVNLMQMLKSEVLSSEILDEEYKGIASEYFDILDEYNGTVVGTITGDECLSGKSPIQGTELCAVCEEMDSLEQLYAYTGETKWIELLEKVAFNAYPATVSDDMCSHQYVQMVNQISCKPFPGRSLFRTNTSDAHIFGLEPNYGCCTANMHQAYPKLVQFAFLRRKNEIHSALPIPCELNTEMNGSGVKIKVNSDYPFRTAFRYTIECQEDNKFELKIRIPHGAEDLTINGWRHSPTRLVVVSDFKKGTTVIDISYSFPIEMKKRPNGFRYVYRGPLVYSLHLSEKWTPVEYERDGVERKAPFCDYFVTSDDKWNYALTSSPLKFVEHGVPDVPFSSKRPPIGIKTELIPVNWETEDGFDDVCSRFANGILPIGEPVSVELVPYGCAKLRVTEMPYYKKEKNKDD